MQSSKTITISSIKNLIVLFFPLSIWIRLHWYLIFHNCIFLPLCYWTHAVSKPLVVHNTQVTLWFYHFNKIAGYEYGNVLHIIQHKRMTIFYNLVDIESFYWCNDESVVIFTSSYVFPYIVILANIWLKLRPVDWSFICQFVKLMWCWYFLTPSYQELVHQHTIHWQSSNLDNKW